VKAVMDELRMGVTLAVLKHRQRVARLAHARVRAISAARHWNYLETRAPMGGLMQTEMQLRRHHCEVRFYVISWLMLGEGQSARDCLKKARRYLRDANELAATQRKAGLR
jgi:hypothetical protein